MLSSERETRSMSFERGTVAIDDRSSPTLLSWIGGRERQLSGSPIRTNIQIKLFLSFKKKTSSEDNSQSIIHIAASKLYPKNHK